MAKRASSRRHSPQDIAQALSLFFAVRGMIRTKLASGKKLDPSAWLRVETMKFVSDHDAPKMKDIAEYLSITAPSATSLVAGLTKSGFVTHAADKHDRRTTRLMLTPEGKAELKRAIARGTELLGGLFTALSAAELVAFTSALEKIKRSTK